MWGRCGGDMEVAHGREPNRELRVDQPAVLDESYPFLVAEQRLLREPACLGIGLGLRLGLGFGLGLGLALWLGLGLGLGFGFGLGLGLVLREPACARILAVGGGVHVVEHLVRVRAKVS